MRRMSTTSIGGGVAAMMVVLCLTQSVASASPSVVISARSRLTEVLGDGTTVYLMDVHLDATEFPSDEVCRVDWRVLGHPDIDVIYVDWPFEDDFFGQGTMRLEIFALPPGLSSRPADVPMNACVTGGNGLLATYEFRVPVDAPYGTTAFELADVAVYTAGYSLDTLPVRVEDLPFTILSPLLGDADCDGDVDLSDFVLLKRNFSTGFLWGHGDFDRDGDVDLQDFVILKSNFGSSINVPEPATLALAGLGFVLALRRRRRRHC